MIEIVLVSLVALVGLFFAALFTGAAYFAGTGKRWSPDAPGRIYEWFARGVLSFGLIALTVLTAVEIGGLS
ncbi:MAG: hypothetical protein LDL26_04575 [Caenispirillum bisanense]|nr:hypothetical protein [Caenispirillum bisanense]MCA1972433.1 hypothetical protein [Caenispirillum sp.]